MTPLAEFSPTSCLTRPISCEGVVPTDRELVENSGVRPALTTTEVAAALGVSRRTVLRRVEDGSIRAMRLGKAVRIPKAELDRLLRF